MDHKVVLFDGICNLCNRSVALIIKHDKNDHFRFAALQSEKGIALSSKYGIDTTKIDSIILIDSHKVYLKSTAVLRIASRLSGLYPLFYILRIIPTKLRNLIYDYIAKNRYTWYGKRESCMVPSLSLMSKFL